MLYVGLVDGAGDAWGCRIPDFPGCNGGGATIEEAVADATSALREYAADMIREGDELPKPRSVQEIVAAVKSEGGVEGIVVLVPLILDSGRTVRANISIDSGLLEAIDEAAERAGVTRSGWIAGCARERLLP
jgi:predicted RNase H-like HicB family nuclease